MARPSSRPGPPSPDAILLVAGGLLVVDSFLPWQQTCLRFILSRCFTAKAWQGNSALLGAVMAALAAALVLAAYLRAARFMPRALGTPSLTLWLARATIGFGTLKFIFAGGNRPGYATWMGGVLILAMAFGLYRKRAESRARQAPGSSLPPPE